MIKKEYEHWKINGSLKELLMECRSKEASRHAIDGIHFANGKIAATDGRRLVEVTKTHKVKLGTYFCTSDGFLLPIEGNFPKYQEIIPPKDKLKKIVETDGEGDFIIGLIFGELCHAGCIINLSLYQRPIKILSKIILGKVRVYVNGKDPAERPFVIEAETSVGDVLYIQIPIKVKNEIRGQIKG